MLGFSISYPYLIKFPFFATSLKEGMGGGGGGVNRSPKKG